MGLEAPYVDFVYDMLHNIELRFGSEKEAVFNAPELLSGLLIAR